MGYIVRMPKLGLEMERGTLLEWAIDEGDSVSEGELIAEVESEKSIGEIEAREDGVLRRTYLEVDETVPPGTPIGIVAPAEADISDLEAEATADLEADVEVEEGEPEPEPDEGTAEPAASGTDTSAGGTTADEITASPRARDRADELGVELTTVEGTGYQGSITEEDVERAASEGADEGAGELNASPRARARADELGVDLAAVDGSGYQGAITEEDIEAAAAETGGTSRTLAEERPFGGMRKTIASRLSESDREAVHVTVHREADAEALLSAADAADATLETDISVQDVLLRAVSAALADHPAFNATFEDDVHELWEEHNVGIAVDIEQGLIAPVLPDVESKSLGELADERRALVDRAISGDYTMDDLQGGTFTVTNLGVLGVEAFDPIINPPQVAILGVDAIDEQPTRGDDDGIEWRRHLPFDLSFDHRVVDGADAARFLETLVDYVEEPWPLLPDEVAEAADRGTVGGAETEMPGRSVTATNPDGMRGRIEAGSFEWTYDEPESSGGTETGPTPVDVALSGLASCLSLSTRFQASKRDMSVEEIQVDVDATPAEGPVEDIAATIRLATDEDDEAVDRLVDLGERGCHVSQMLREELELDLSWERL
ncbi:pyruvate dehydrogenase E2 component (dihydrolipoamide acetyltransferase) [Natrinema hispanicum]|uniref:Pyruvate dehydrogenase E2 component (Dihydrolipoamide acetyltransferase) n=1 Tax=Natrinema hispanicum TaxID=392421 RepID=A0A482Y9E8_9EURY|nr:2-oxo acid dehydrogenase subunit E2 [Natrinema hispanicum]RZV08065.1 pyruvate dehydrogenase E2 component (dihydrolipoamide acetyltransferase) [Natrinema hispanicum]